MFYTVSARRTSEMRILFAFLFFCTFICGLLLGTCVAAHNADRYSSLICTAAASPQNAFGSFSRCAVAFTLTALILWFKRSYLFLLIFAEAFTYGISVTAVYLTYSSPQWLVCWLILFSRTIILILLVWFWSRNIFGHQHTVRRDFFWALFISILATLMDLHWISPHLPRLFI